MNKKNIQSISLILLLACLVVLLIAIFSPYATALFWSAILYILCSPPYKAIIKRLNPEKKGFTMKRKALAAFFAVFTVVLISGVLLFFGFFIIRQCLEITENLKSLLLSASINETETSMLVGIENLVDKITEQIYTFTNSAVDLRSVDVKSLLLEYLSKYSNTIFTFGKSLVTSTGNLVLSLAFICFSLYFFYVDGNNLVTLFTSAIPIETSSTKRLLSKFSESVSQLVTGLVLVALYQACAAFLIFNIFNISGSLFFAMATFFGAFIPLVGSGIVWVPISFVLFFTVSKVKGILFFIAAGTVISLMDNVLRPLILKDTIKIHPLLIFFSLLGGVKLMGLKGVILGPMAIIIFFTVLDLTLNSESQEAMLESQDSGESPAPPQALTMQGETQD